MYNAQKLHNSAAKTDGTQFRPCLFCIKDLPKHIKRRLCDNFNFRVISLPAFEKLEKPVAAHPDMLLFKYKSSLIMHSDYFKANSSLFDFLSLDIVLSNELISAKYPNDVRFNAFFMGDTLFCRKDSISRCILDLFEKRAYVNQGYAACSVCKVDQTHLITADKGIAKAASERGFFPLLISPGNIILKGYDCGFIGGASFASDSGVFFFGNIDKHPDGERIKSFIKECGKGCISLSDDCLCDFGGALIIDTSVQKKTPFAT